MTEYLVSGLVEGYRIEKTVSAVSLHHAIRLFESMYSNAQNVYVLE